jgi:hypothetical protein
LIDESSSSPDASGDVPAVSVPLSDACETEEEQAKLENASPPLFVMMERSDVSNARKTKMNRKTIIVARKNAMQ